MYFKELTHCGGCQVQNLQSALLSFEEGRLERVDAVVWVQRQPAAEFPVRWKSVFSINIKVFNCLDEGNPLYSKSTDEIIILI